MYDVSSYVGTNELGTAVLLEAVSRHPVERMIIASSMSVYGEGLPGEIGRTGFAAGAILRADPPWRWELADTDGERLTPVATPEDKPPSLNSIYALNKFAQERMALIIGGPTTFRRCTAVLQRVRPASGFPIRIPACWRYCSPRYERQ